MTDTYGFKEAASRGITLGNIGNRIVLENELVRIWEVHLEPGQTIDWHFHFHPYTVISLGGDKNEIETIFGEKIPTNEPTGATVFIDKLATVHRLTNRSSISYTSRLVELKQITWSPEGKDAVKSNVTREMTLEEASVLKEYMLRTSDLTWVDKSLAGLSHKMLWRNERTGASLALVKFDKGSGVPNAHAHASDQLMYCISGRYRYIPTGTILTPGSFYCNPKGSVHGPTIADETSILLEVYDGPHYPVRPPWYTNDDDAR